MQTMTIQPVCFTFCTTLKHVHDIPLVFAKLFSEATPCFVLCHTHTQARKEEQMLKRRNVAMESESPLTEYNKLVPLDLSIPAIVAVSGFIGQPYDSRVMLCFNPALSFFKVLFW